MNDESDIVVSMFREETTNRLVRVRGRRDHGLYVPMYVEVRDGERYVTLAELLEEDSE